MKQTIDLSSPTAVYPIGWRYQLNNRVFHYARAGGALTPNMGAMVKNPQEVSQHVLGAAAKKGDTSIVITLDATDGPTYNGLLPKDYLAGGYVVVFQNLAGAPAFVRGINSNTAIITAGGLTTIKLDAPIDRDLNITDVAEAMASMYACVCAHADTKLVSNLCTTVGIPACKAASGEYLFLQTWGPCWNSPHGDVGRDIAQDRAAYLVGDGSFGEGKEHPTGALELVGLISQYAGDVLANAKGGGQGAPFVMLRLDP
jgi:hypothetical protein